MNDVYGIIPGSMGANDLARQTSGVECRKDVGVLDEIPGAYKSIEAVMKNQEDWSKSSPRSSKWFA